MTPSWIKGIGALLKLILLANPNGSFQNNVNYYVKAGKSTFHCRTHCGDMMRGVCWVASRASPLASLLFSPMTKIN